MSPGARCCVDTGECTRARWARLHGSTGLGTNGLKCAHVAAAVRNKTTVGPPYLAQERTPRAVDDATSAKRVRLPNQERTPYNSRRVRQASSENNTMQQWMFFELGHTALRKLFGVERNNRAQSAMPAELPGGAGTFHWKFQWFTMHGPQKTSLLKTITHHALSTLCSYPWWASHLHAQKIRRAVHGSVGDLSMFGYRG